MAVAETRETGTDAALRYFSRLQGAFDAAADRLGGAIEHDLQVGPWTVRLRFAGDELVPIMLPALSHLLAPARADREPDSTISIWDSASTGVSVPPFTWRPMQVRQRGEIEGMNDERFRTIYHGDPLADDLGFDAISMRDAATGHGIFWVSSTERINWYEPAEPMRTLMHWSLDGPGRYLAHSAVVGNENGTVLLAGKGGSGKTTTTLACLQAGMGFVADNYTLLELGDEPTAYSLYCNVKLTDDTLKLLPGFADEVNTFDVEEGEKLIVDVARNRPAQMTTGVPVKALLVPTVIGHGQTRVVPASRVEGLIALAPTTVYQLPENGGVLSQMAELVRKLPVYRLELGGDVMDSPRVIARLLENGGAA